MPKPPSLRRMLQLLPALICAGLAGGGVQATEALEARTLDAVARALGFLESAPRNGDFVVAVVYRSETPGSQAVAEDIARRLSDRPGPRRTRIRADAYEVDELLASSERVDALLLTLGAEIDAARIAQFVEQNRILSVSNDPACFDAGACVLMVSTDREVEIVLDTQLAGRVGAQFSTVFTMMVTRR